MSQYKTEIITVDSLLLDEQIKPAALALRCGELVAFPTETVYGLGANALDEAAVAKIFEVKGRPADNPLIIHVSDAEELTGIVLGDSEIAKLLLKTFSPGPLTLVLPRDCSVPDIVTAGLDTVAVRIPSHQTALKLIKAAGVPVAAPSANRSGRPSPTRAWHVYEDLSGLIPYIIDDGACEFGLESTVLDLTGSVPVILRPGAITAEMIEKQTGIKVISNENISGKDQIPKAPGMKYRHYAPNAQVYVAKGDNIEDRADEINRITAKQGLESKLFVKIGLFSCVKTRNLLRDKWYPLNDNIEETGKVYIDYAFEPDSAAASRKLFSALRKFDQAGVDLIIAEALPADGMGSAYMNRLLKAASEVNLTWR